MIDTKFIRGLLEEKIKNSPFFIVDISINPGNRIQIYLDSKSGVSINDCAEMSRYIENNLNRDTEDFALEVSSAGLNMPFRVDAQYNKNIGKNVKVKTKDGQVYKGKLQAYCPEELVLEIKQSPAKHSKIEKKIIPNDLIAETKLDLSFIK